MSKAEVIDSLERTAGEEFDAVIYDQSTASVLNVVGQRCIVRVENVAVIVEVKSKLEAATGADEERRVREGIGKLRRVFQATPFLKLIRKTSEHRPDLWQAA